MLHCNPGMTRNKVKNIFSLILISATGINLFAASSQAAIRDTGGKGAEIYCYMRQNGNEHEVSWNAAYALIKRQTNGIFKTSPQHAALMITEAVVQEPNNYEGCGSYLGDLFGANKIETINKDIPKKNAKNKDRYSY